jgi:hypothetical protein
MNLFRNVYRQRLIGVRGIPHQIEGHALPFRDSKGYDSFEVLAAKRRFRTQGKHVGPGNCGNPMAFAANPGNHGPVIEANHEFQFHLNLASCAGYSTAQQGRLAPRGHEINQGHRPMFRVKFGLQN